MGIGGVNDSRSRWLLFRALRLIRRRLWRGHLLASGQWCRVLPGLDAAAGGDVIDEGIEVASRSHCAIEDEVGAGGSHEVRPASFAADRIPPEIVIEEQGPDPVFFSGGDV